MVENRGRGRDRGHDVGGDEEEGIEHETNRHRSRVTYFPTKARALTVPSGNYTHPGRRPQRDRQ